MISILLLIFLGLLVLVSLGIKMTSHTLPKSWDIALCMIVPILCLLAFLSIIVESSIKRKADINELNSIIPAIEFSINSNRIFLSNEEKEKCLDSLKFYSNRINAISSNDSLISIIAGKDTCMQRRIKQASNAVMQNITWIGRLNNLLEKKIEYTTKQIDKDNIKLIGPGSPESSVMNIAFKFIGSAKGILCTHVQVVRNDSIIFAQSFDSNHQVNCYNIPFSHQQGEQIEIGYITQYNDTTIFNYIVYAK